MVLAFHLLAYFRVVAAGWLGVDVFFALSGFLITALLLQEWHRRGKIALGRFYARRALRLAPALALMLLACFVYARTLCGPEESRFVLDAIPPCMLYVSNWVMALGGNPDCLGMLSHTWSLSAEEQFYLLWPALLLALLALGLRHRGLMVLVAAGATAGVARRLVLVGKVSCARLYLGLDTHGADSLLIGCLAALAWAARQRRPGAGERAAWGAAALASLALWAWMLVANPLTFDAYASGLAPSVVALSAVAVILAVVWAHPPLVCALLARPWLVWTGRLSYGFYLWHYPVFAVVMHPMAPYWPLEVSAPLAVALTLLTTAASYYGLERPLLRLKDRLHAPAGPPAARRHAA
jgi:peptidoglycan/LPS O-acetylase OafA/YrhL